MQIDNEYWFTNWSTLYMQKMCTLYNIASLYNNIL